MPTYKEYAKLCQQIGDTGASVYTVQKACAEIEKLNSPFVIVKHDVEADISKALKLSEIEHQAGISATYYVHSFFMEDPKAIPILQKMARMGHEIGYHYDVLDHNNGDKAKAIVEFKAALSRFADYGFEIKSICPHGNPLKKRVGYSSNKDFFLDPSIRNQFDDIVDVYITFPEMAAIDYLYITDAGYAYYYRDAKTTKTDATEVLLPLGREADILRMIQEGHSMVLSTHSHRYVRYAFVGAARKWLYKVAKFMAKACYRTKWGRNLIDKFYFFAKQI